ncbi:MAG: hypothetical protein ACOC1O_00290 [bacterium]
MGLLIFRLFFFSLIGLSFLIMLIKNISNVLKVVKNEYVIKDFFDKFFITLENLLYRKSILFLLVGTIISLTLFHILPYYNQERDYMLIDEYVSNIELYEDYSEDYAEAARQQIEQYQQLQSEMARNATIAQLQFFAEQEDAVGNSLTNEIRRFQNLIMEQELEINKARSRINRRPNNKWYFGIGG